MGAIGGTSGLPGRHPVIGIYGGYAAWSLG